jgi:hypothetical protein
VTESFAWSMNKLRRLRVLIEDELRLGEAEHQTDEVVELEQGTKSRSRGDR